VFHHEATKASEEASMHRRRPDHPASVYLRLAEGPEDLLDTRPSATRRLLTLAAALLFLSGTSLFATAVTDLDAKLVADKAVAASGPGKGDDDDGSSGPGGGDDDTTTDDATDDSRTKTGTKSRTRGDSTDSKSDERRDGNTDSSRGRDATDSGSRDDRTGKTDSSRRGASDDSHSDDNENGDSDSSRGASRSRHSRGTDDTRGHNTRG
jgi:hypothetical protein